MSTRARATSMRAIRHGARKLTARARAVRALLSTGTKGRIPALWSDAGWFRDRNRTQPWVYPQDLEQQVQWVDDLTGQPRGWALGPDLVKNGSFSNGTTDWQPHEAATGGAISVVNGQLVGNSSTTSNIIAKQVIPTTAGRRYLIQWDQISTNQQMAVYFGTGINQATSFLIGNNIKRSEVLIADVNNEEMYIVGSTFNANATIDNISVREVILDDSWLGPQLVTTYASGGAYGNYNAMSLAGTVLTASTAPSNGYFARFPVTAGRSYLISLPTPLSASGGNWQIQVAWSADGTSLGGIFANFPISSTSCPFAAPATAVSCEVIIQRSAASSGGATDTCTGFVGFTVREIPGNPSVSPSAGNGPTATARVNLFERTEQFDNAYWTKTAAFITPNAALAPDATTTADLFYEDSASGTHIVRRDVSIIAGVYKFSVCCKAGPSADRNVSIGFNSAVQGATFSLQDGSVLNKFAGTTTFSQNLGNGWFRFTIQASLPTATENVRIWLSNSTAFAPVYAGNGTSGILIWGADLRLAAYDSLNLPAYQRVGDGSAGVFDYDHVGFPVRLVRGAANRGLMTLGTLDLTGTDAVNAGMWVLKTSDSAAAALMEMSSNSNSNTGVAVLYAPHTNGSAAFTFGSKGSLPALTARAIGSAASPAIGALLGTGRISTDTSTLFVNGAQAASVTDDQGTGNYGNHRLYEGGRSLDSSPSLSFTGEWLPGFVVDANGVPADLAAEVLREYAAAVNFYY